MDSSPSRPTKGWHHNMLIVAFLLFLSCLGAYDVLQLSIGVFYGREVRDVRRTWYLMVKSCSEGRKSDARAYIQSDSNEEAMDFDDPTSLDLFLGEYLKYPQRFSNASIRVGWAARTAVIEINDGPLSRGRRYYLKRVNRSNWVFTGVMDIIED